MMGQTNGSEPLTKFYFEPFRRCLPISARLARAAPSCGHPFQAMKRSRAPRAGKAERNQLAPWTNCLAEWLDSLGIPVTCTPRTRRAALPQPPATCELSLTSIAFHRYQRKANRYIRKINVTAARMPLVSLLSMHPGFKQEP